MYVAVLVGGPGEIAGSVLASKPLQQATGCLVRCCSLDDPTPNPFDGSIFSCVNRVKEQGDRPMIWFCATKAKWNHL